MRTWALAAILFWAALSPGDGGDAALGPITVSHAWARATPMSAKTGVIYLTLGNSGSDQDELVSASTPVAGSVEVHTSMDDGGIMKMNEVMNLGLPPKAVVVLEPSATHLMLLNLTRRLAEGDRFLLTLTFQRAGPVNVDVLVGKVGAMTDPAGGD